MIVLSASAFEIGLHLGLQPTIYAITFLAPVSYALEALEISQLLVILTQPGGSKTILSPPFYYSIPDDLPSILKN